MTTGVVYDGVPGADGEAFGARPKLFSGMKFWLSHSIPQRQWLLQNAQANGAEIVPLEKQADILFVDHARKNQAPGTHSYRFIELSIRNGQLEDPDAHAVGVATRVQRTVGSIITAPKRGRNPFTSAEDQWLWNMIKPYMDAGGNWKGNEIYKQLERLNSRHTYQSWRDRWIKYVVHQNRQITQHLDRDAMIDELQESNQAPTPQPTAGVAQASRAPEPQIGASERPASSAQPVNVDTADVLSPRPAADKRQVAFGDNEGAAALPAKSRVRYFGPEKRSRLLTNDQSRPRTPQTAGSGLNQQQRSPTPPAVTPQHLRTPGFHRDPVVFTRAELGRFTAKEAGELYGRTKYVEYTTRRKRDEAWEAFAEDWKESGHTVGEWKGLYDTVILPKYRSRRESSGAQAEVEPSGDEELLDNDLVRRKLVATTKSASSDEEADTDSPQESDIRSISYKTTCFKCLISESTGWRYDRKGRTLCDDCSRLSQTLGVLRPSTALIDVENEAEEDDLDEGSEEMGNQEVKATEHEEGSDIEEENLHQGQRLKRRRKSPQLSLSLTAGRIMVDRGSSPIVPLHNTTRTRQDSPLFEPLSPSTARLPGPNEARKRSAARSQSTSQETAKSQVSFKEATEEKFLRRLQTPPVSLKKRKRLSDDPNSLEIPPTPEHVQQDSGSFNLMPAQHASPQLLRVRPVPRKQSPPPKSMLFMNESEDEEEVDDDACDEITPTSPLMVNLVSDPVARSSQPNQEEDNSSDIETASIYNFETAPDISHEWETAPESPGQAQARVETQALFNISNAIDLTEDDFELPAPEGGWEALEGPEPDVVESVEVAKDEAEPSSGAHVTTWITSHKARWPTLNQRHLENMLQAAIESTSFDFDIAEQVVEQMIRTYRSGKATKVLQEGGVMLPEDICGCWTEEDDNLLFSGDPPSIARVHKKHGNDNCNERLTFVEAWQAT